MFSFFRRRRHSSLEMQARPPVVAGRSEADLIESVAEGMVGCRGSRDIEAAEALRLARSLGGALAKAQRSRHALQFYV
jgi:hypothetical protein